MDQATDRALAPASFETEAATVRRNPWVMGVAMAPFALVLAAILAAFVVSPAMLLFALHGAGLGGLTTWLAWGRNPWPRLSHARVRIDATELHIGRRRYPRSTLKAGKVVPARGQVTVLLERRGGKLPLSLRVADDQQAYQVLHALGLAPEQTVGHFRTMSRIFSAWWKTPAVVSGAGLAGALLTAVMGRLFGGPALVGLPLFVALAVAALALAPTRVDVGADGVLVTWLGRKRFIPHRSIVGVLVATDGFGNNRRRVVELLLESGEKYVLPTGSAMFDFGQATALAERIRAAQAVEEQAEPVAPDALLRRAERSHHDWVAALLDHAALATHRRAPVKRESLWRIVEDSKAEPLERAAAAVALRKDLNDRDRARLGRVAEATAAPKLRIVLEPSEGAPRPAELAQALADIEAEQSEAAPAPARR